MKTFVRWNNPIKLFCPNIYGSEDITDQRMYKMQMQNLLKNAIIQARLMQMSWNLACEPFSWKILCLWEKRIFFMTNMSCFSHFQDMIFPPFPSKIFICHKIFTSSVIPFLKLEAKCCRVMQRNPWANLLKL